MGGRNVAGHFLTLTPLSAIRHPRKAPDSGWMATCKCGWHEQPFASKLLAEIAYRNHKLSHLPICGRCCAMKQAAEMSRSKPYRCKRCARIEHKDWIKRNPKEWDRSRRKSHLKNQYGITPEQYESMLAAQGGGCAICQEEPKDSRGFRPHVDHCHETGAIRGILCGPCNKGIGSLRDSPELVRRALEYLIKGKVEITER
jgi:Recombination endonuclease VII